MIASSDLLKFDLILLELCGITISKIYLLKITFFSILLLPHSFSSLFFIPISSSDFFYFFLFSGTWFFLYANALFTVFSFILLFAACYTGDPNQIFMWLSSAANSFFFLVGSFYYVSGTYDKSNYVHVY